MQLAKFPRVKLIHSPTPLEHLENLSKFLGGPEIFIKRDDCTGLAFGGNKSRKLEFLIGDALKNEADIVITAGAVQSNHCRQTAAAANGLAAGNYSVTVTDANGCTDPSIVTITEPTALTATIAATDATCNGVADGSASVTASGGTAIPSSTVIPSALISFTNWGGVEPNNAAGGEDYAHFRGTDGTWNDHLSTYTLNHVMEAESDLPCKTIGRIDLISSPKKSLDNSSSRAFIRLRLPR